MVNRRANGREAADRPVSGSHRARLSRLVAATAPAAAAGRRSVTSRELAHNTGLSHSQVRRDLRGAGAPGTAGVGYTVGPLLLRLHARLGAPSGRLALVGTQGFAPGLLESPALAELDIEVVCVFDDEPSPGRRGAPHSCLGHRVLPFGAIEAEVSRHGLEAAVIATGSARAPEAYERLCAAGVRLVVSFAGGLLERRPGVVVHEVEPAVPLHQALSATLAGRRAFSSASRASSPTTNSRN